MRSRFGSHGFNKFVNVRWPKTCGYQPVRIEARLGEQTLCCPNACTYAVPRSANASIAGVCTTGLPNAPTASARNWSGMNNKMLGRAMATAWQITSRRRLSLPVRHKRHRHGQRFLAAAFVAAFFGLAFLSGSDATYSSALVTHGPALA